MSERVAFPPHASPGVTEQDVLREHIRLSGCYSQEENLRIYNKYFTSSRPRDHLFNALDQRFHFSSQTVCDAGCEFGMHLLRCAAGSYGLEIEEYSYNFSRSIGLAVYHRDIIKDDLRDLARVDTVWSVATIEHVDSPHVFLRKLHALLNPDGLLILETPVRRGPPLAWLGLLPVPVFHRLYRDDHDDHVNAFTPATLRYYCERAGFATIDCFLWSLPLVNNFRKLPPLLTRYWPLNMAAMDCVYIGRKVDGWEYPNRSARRVANNNTGYVYAGRIP